MNLDAIGPLLVLLPLGFAAHRLVLALRVRRRIRERLGLVTTESQARMVEAWSSGSRVFCYRCGGPILAGEITVAGPPTRSGPQTAHYDCPLTPTRPEGLPGDKRWRASYDRDTERLLALFPPTRLEPLTQGGPHALEADNPGAHRPVFPVHRREGRP